MYEFVDVRDRRVGSDERYQEAVEPHQGGVRCIEEHARCKHDPHDFAVDEEGGDEQCLGKCIGTCLDPQNS